ncbi:hypothetical protein NA78x_000155 [Anatilimnocola sp. NA78]|uniref:hypothetical protein n=1 Tax=Anatilimnocola sp. NA78 TaxID=3415683 RepID=UPI003CE4F43A
MIKFSCGACGVKIRAKPEKAGTNAKCPKCHSPIAIPMSEDQEVLVAEPVIEPFEFKGDRLGMQLSAFKAKHHRLVQGHDKPIPWCSDICEGVDNDSLFSKAYFAEAGLANCRLDFPFEAFHGRDPQTVAGVPTTLLLYHFVDAQLFKVSAFFEAGHTEAVLAALTAKYSSPRSHDDSSYIWENDVSTIVLIRGKRKNQWKSDSSILFFVHVDLNKLAESREPGPAVDDL